MKLSAEHNQRHSSVLAPQSLLFLTLYMKVSLAEVGQISQASIPLC